MSVASSGPLRVFIVENHADTLECLCYYLESKGHSIRSASSVMEALKEIPSTGSDVILCDIGLSDGSGWDLLHQLHQPIFAIAMSGFGTNSDRAKSLDAGFREHLIKPFSLQKLDALLESALAEREKLPATDQRGVI
jgi:two-component system CheB/CheR fusion protein